MLNGLENIDLSAPDAMDKINALAKGLTDSKQSLQDDLKRTKGLLGTEDSAQEKLRALEASIESADLLKKENYDGALAHEKKQHTEAMEKLVTSNETNEALIRSLLIDNGLSAELVKLGVNKDLMPLIQQGFSAQATIVDGRAVIGEKSLSDYMKEWGDTPQGKASRVGQKNSNSEGLGGNESSQGKTMTEMSGAERTALFQSNPTLFNQLKAEM